jgi:hypothetical protein
MLVLLMSLNEHKRDQVLRRRLHDLNLSTCGVSGGMPHDRSVVLTLETPTTDLGFIT